MANGDGNNPLLGQLLERLPSLFDAPNPHNEGFIQSHRVREGWRELINRQTRWLDGLKREMELIEARLGVFGGAALTGTLADDETPDAADGSNGDAFVAEDGRWWVKVDGAWVQQGSLAEVGNAGTVYSDAVLLDESPEATLGADGDVFIATDGRWWVKGASEWDSQGDLTVTKAPELHTGTLAADADPDDTLGVSGDLFFAEDGRWWRKVSGAWVAQGNLKGADGIDGLDGDPGSDGTTILRGDIAADAAPDNADGADGDQFVANDGRWWKKEAGAWVAQGTLKGADGLDGVQGKDSGRWYPFTYGMNYENRNQITADAAGTWVARRGAGTIEWVAQETLTGTVYLTNALFEAAVEAGTLAVGDFILVDLLAEGQDAPGDTVLYLYQVSSVAGTVIGVEPDFEVFTPAPAVFSETDETVAAGAAPSTTLGDDGDLFFADDGRWWKKSEPEESITDDVVDWDEVNVLSFNKIDSQGYTRNNVFQAIEMQGEAGGVPIAIRREGGDTGSEYSQVAFITTGPAEFQDNLQEWFVPVKRVTNESFTSDETPDMVNPPHDSDYDLFILLPQLTWQPQFFGARTAEQYVVGIEAELARDLDQLSPDDDWPDDAVEAADRATRGVNRPGDIVTLYLGSSVHTRTWDATFGKWVSYGGYVAGPLVVRGGIQSDHLGAQIISADKIVPNQIGRGLLKRDQVVIDSSVQIGDGIITFRNIHTSLLGDIAQGRTFTKTLTSPAADPGVWIDMVSPSDLVVTRNAADEDIRLDAISSMELMPHIQTQVELEHLRVRVFPHAPLFLVPTLSSQFNAFYRWVEQRATVEVRYQVRLVPGPGQTGTVQVIDDRTVVLETPLSAQTLEDAEDGDYFIDLGLVNDRLLSWCLHEGVWRVSSGSVPSYHIVGPVERGLKPTTEPGTLTLHPRPLYFSTTRGDGRFWLWNWADAEWRRSRGNQFFYHPAVPPAAFFRPDNPANYLPQVRYLGNSSATALTAAVLDDYLPADTYGNEGDGAYKEIYLASDATRRLAAMFHKTEGSWSRAWVSGDAPWIITGDQTRLAEVREVDEGVAPEADATVVRIITTDGRVYFNSGNAGSLVSNIDGALQPLPDATELEGHAPRVFSEDIPTGHTPDGEILGESDNLPANRFIFPPLPIIQTGRIRTKWRDLGLSSVRAEIVQTAYQDTIEDEAAFPGTEPVHEGDQEGVEDYEFTAAQTPVGEQKRIEVRMQIVSVKGVSPDELTFNVQVVAREVRPFS